MGDTLFAEFPELVKSADEILGYSIAQICLEDPKNLLNNTEYTQPALYVVSALSYLKKRAEDSAAPTFLAGHSLGEYNALFAAGVFDFVTGLKLLQKSGALMSQATGGGMAAIVGLKSAAVLETIDKNNLKDVAVANYNSHLQTVITGSKESINAVQAIFIQAGATLYLPLKVSGAFHSSFMEPAQNQFADFLRNFNFSAPQIPVIANVDAKQYQPDKIQENLARQISHPVLWLQTIENLVAQGETNFHEIGPGKVLSGLIARIQKGQ